MQGMIPWTKNRIFTQARNLSGEIKILIWAKENKMKKKGKKPTLSSLYPGKLEESVLCGCKTRATSGPTNARGQCDMAGGYYGYHCSICHAPQTTWELDKFKSLPCTLHYHPTIQTIQSKAATMDQKPDGLCRVAKARGIWAYKGRIFTWQNISIL